MSKFSSKPKATYDAETKTWSGPSYKHFYDRDCSFGLIAYEELRRRPNHVLQICDTDNTRLTNNDVLLYAVRLVRYFESLGIKQSDVIGLSARNSTYVICVAVACYFCGTAYNAISPNLDKATSKHIWNIIRPKVIFCDGQDMERIRFASSEFESKIFTLTNHLEGVPPIMDLLKPTGDEYDYVPAELEHGTDQNVMILCSSGSTGLPKPVSIPHSNYAYRAFDYTTADDVHFVGTTLDWTTGSICLMACIVYGSTRIVSDRLFTPEYFLEVVQKYKVTLTLQTPPTTATLSSSPHISAEKLDSLRYYLMGGSICQPSLVRSMQAYLRNGQVVIVYGFTELIGVLTRCFFNEYRPGTIGKLLPGYKARIVDDEGKALGPGESGEMLCTRNGTWKGYYKNPEATSTIYDEHGWYHTGDLCYFDDDNYLFMKERLKDLLKYKSMHYYPTEIEQVIAQLADVKEVCVFGIEKDCEGEMAAAAVVTVDGSALTPEDVVEHVRKHIEAFYKQLHGGCKIFKSIPRTANNKYDRRATKNAYLSE